MSECETVLALSAGCRFSRYKLRLRVGWPEKRDICRLSEHSFRTCWGGAVWCSPAMLWGQSLNAKTVFLSDRDCCYINRMVLSFKDSP